MYIIDVYISENREVKINNNHAGNIGENNSAFLNFIIPDKYSDFFKYLDIDMGKKGKTQTVVSTNNETKFSYPLPSQLTLGTNLLLQLVLKKGSQIFKSNLFTIVFNGSLCAAQVLESDFKDSIQTIMETKADLDIINELDEKKLAKSVFYDFQNSQNVINNLKADKDEFNKLKEDFINETEKINENIEDLSKLNGQGTESLGQYSHAEGKDTKANGDYSHAEGYITNANGFSSHSEGKDTKANGDYSHAEGYGTITASQNQHTQGTYNIVDTEGKYAHIVGNGSKSMRSNAHTLDWNGNAWFAGDITVGENLKKVLTEDNIDELEEAIISNNNYSNALKDSMFDQVIRIDDVSPIEHIADIKVGSKNIVNIDDMVSNYGICNFADNGDQTYTLTKYKGKRFSEAFKFNKPLSKDTVITVSCTVVEHNATDNLKLQIVNAEGKHINSINFKSNVVRIYTCPEDISLVRFYLSSNESDGAYVTIKDFQIELGNRKTEYTTNEIDLSNVKLLKYGKNLFTLDNDKRFTKQADGSYISNTTIGTMKIPFYLPAGKYAISYMSKSPTNENARFRFTTEKGTTYQTYKSGNTGELRKVTVILNFDSPVINYWFDWANPPTEGSFELKDIQIETGDTLTNYEEYSKEEYSVNADGTVDGVIMNYPTTTLFTDTPGLTVNVKYNKDANKVIEKLTNAIISLGGNI